MQEHGNRQSIKQKDSFRIMCLGESTTRCQYSSYLEEILNQRNIGIKFSVIDKGIDGTHTKEILSELKANLDKYQPDMAITMMGINDGGSHMPYETTSASKITLALRSFKIYKLARFLWLHAATKSKEIVYQDFRYFNYNNDYKYIKLDRLYRSQDESEQILEKAIELDPNNSLAYIALGWFYQCQRRLVDSEQVMKKAMKISPKNYNIFGRLSAIYSEIGEDKLADIYAEKANNLRGKYYESTTVNNYRMLEQILYRKNVKLVCMQYPMRNIEPLKNIFKEKGESDIIFVDNERIFKDVVRNEGCKTYFRDMFGGDFGHCTDKGNKLLAENIANTILKEYFNK
ncbi:MAG: hypothetical protein CO035_04425 [Candidatus Omnitrophica bacterium CG_4_9_14_0_2_um_filter_42_8]|nr:MAG: hypothetical protein CO035_04425 [Candidatus Omnitrophica bacterium CG_4_9_14_0_2_um_filter_42_8]